jgi:xanthine/uracil permease
MKLFEYNPIAIGLFIGTGLVMLMCLCAGTTDIKEAADWFVSLFSNLTGFQFYFSLFLISLTYIVIKTYRLKKNEKQWRREM